MAMEFTYSMFFNTIFTIIPTATVGVFDFDLSAELSMKIPQIYQKGIQQYSYNAEKYFLYLAHAIFQSIVCYFGVTFLFDGTIASDGTPADSITQGTILATAAIFIVNIFNISNWYSWTWVTVVSLVASLGSWILYLTLYSLNISSPTYGLINFLKVPTFYLNVLVILIVAFMPRIIIKYIQQVNYPTDTDLLQEHQKISKNKRSDHIRTEPPENPDSLAVPAAESYFKPIMINQGPPKVKINTSVPSPVSDGFSPRIPEPSKASEDFHSVNESEKLHSSKENVHTRAPSRNSALLIGVQKVVKIIKGAGDKKFGRLGRGASLMYMNGRGAVPNTGYAFSQDTGMADIITPLSEFPDELPEPETKKLQNTTAKIRNISKSLQGVFKIRGIYPMKDKETEEKIVKTKDTTSENDLKQKEIAIVVADDDNDQEEAANQSVLSSVSSGNTSDNVDVADERILQASIKKVNEDIAKDE
jgi:phospholipid-translocating ATPase